MRTSSGGPPAPFSPEELAKIRLAQSSFRFFLMYIYPESFAGRTFRMADGKRHQFSLGWIHYVWAAIVEDNPRVCILAPRMHLKSTVLNHAFAFWKMFSARQDVKGIVMSYKDTLAKDHTRALKTAVAANPYCRFWVDRKGQAESIVEYEVSFGGDESWVAEVDPFGVLSNVRGRHPNFLICDDILGDFANALEPVQLRRIHRVFQQSLESLPDENESLIVIGTPQSYEDTLYQLKKNQAYYWARFQAEYRPNVPLWPEKFDMARLKRVKRALKNPAAYQVEYMLVPLMATNSFLPRDVVEQCVDAELEPWDEAKPWDLPYPTYMGIDVGKHVHPTHLSIGAQMPTGDLVQVHQEFLDGMNYKAQASRINYLVAAFDVKRAYFDSSRGELEDRLVSKRVIGKKFTKQLKPILALGLEGRIFADDDEPGIVLLQDDRQVGQMVAVDRTLKSIETEEGHGDSFWSNALMCRAAFDGPVIVMLGNAQDSFGGRGRRANPLIVGRNAQASSGKAS